MIVEPRASSHYLIEQFLETLRALPEVQAKLEHTAVSDSAGSRGPDAKVDLWFVDKEGVTLLVEFKKTVYPRDVGQVIWKGRHFSDDTLNGKGKTQLLLVAESISPGAKELLKAERVGYYDSGGSLYLSTAGAYLYIDKPPPKALAKSLHSLFSGRRAQVLHTLLMRHRDWFSVKALAVQSLVSPATTSQVLSELERNDWLTTRGQGPNKERRMEEPGALLDAWTKQLPTLPRPSQHRYYLPAFKNTEKLIDHVGGVCDAFGADYAITHEAAAQRYAPFLTNISQIRCRLLPGRKFDVVIGELEAREVTEGVNFVILEAKSAGDFLYRERVGEVWLASPIDVYLDLLRSEGRAKEMAEHLRKERIGF